MNIRKFRLGSNLLFLITMALTLSITMLPMVIISGCDDDDDGNGRRSEQEPNNTFQECNLVGLSTIRIQGDIDPADDIDDFCFDVEAGATVSFVVDSDILLQLFGPEPENDLLEENTSSLEFTIEESGRYHIVASDPGGGGGISYGLTITETGPPVPTPSVSPTPTPTTSPTPTPTTSPTPTPQIHNVSMIDNEFVQDDITINVGDTVRWTNNGQLNHTVTSSEGPGDIFNSDDEFPLPTGMEPGDVFEFTFTEEGDFPYFCEFHGTPGGVGMAGTITVEP